MRGVPNMLTFARLGLALVLAGCLTWPREPLWLVAMAVLILAAITDRLDGWLARRFNAETELGRMLDPLADKAVVVTALVGLMAGGVLAGPHAFGVMLIVLREFLVSGCRDLLAHRGFRLPVTPLARWKTAVQMIAAVLLLAGAASSFKPLAQGGLIVFWLAVALTLWTGAGYVREALTLARQDR